MRAFQRRLFSSGIAWNKYSKDSWTNIPVRLEQEWFGRGLLQIPEHPLARAKQRIVNALEIEHFESLDPVVTIEENFDSLLIKADHVSRSVNDTYYVNAEHVLRTHTTAHQDHLLRNGPSSWIVSGDVYRRDTIDSTHFPVFHQMDAARVFPVGTTEKEAERNLKELLEHLTRGLFGQDVQIRWREDYFPFTLPSWELDVYFNGEWMELLGSGLIHPEIMKNINRSDQIGWAFGMGLERLAMVLYQVNDIRTFWSRDERFLKQFANLPLEAPIAFKEYSKYPKTRRDISFWIEDEATFHENLFFEIVREICGDLVENVEKMDFFTHPKTNKQSYAFRIDYRSMDRTLESSEINIMQEKVREIVAQKLNVTLR